MRICVFHCNLNVKNPIIFGMCVSCMQSIFLIPSCVLFRSVSALFTFLMVCGLLPIFLNFAPKTRLLADVWDSKPIQIIKAW